MSNIRDKKKTKMILSLKPSVLMAFDCKDFMEP